MSDDNGKKIVDLQPALVAQLFVEGKVSRQEADILSYYSPDRWQRIYKQAKDADELKAFLENLTARYRKPIQKARIQLRGGASLPEIGAGRPVYNLLTLLRSEPSTPKDIVPRLLPAGGAIGLAGEFGSLKSYLLLDLFLHLVTGEEWLGLPVPQMPVLLLDRENKPRKLYERAICLGAGKYTQMANEDFPFVVIGDLRYSLDDPRFVDEVTHHIEVVGAGGPVVVGLDSMVDFLGSADENNNSEMHQCASHVRELCNVNGATVITLCHVPTGTGGTRRQKIRGASAVAYALDVVIQATTTVVVKDEAQTTYRIKLAQQKNRDGDPSEMSILAHFADKDKETGRGTRTLFEPAIPVYKQDSESVAIREALDDGEWHLASELVSALVEAEKGKRSTLQSRLGDMRETGEVETDREPVQGSSYKVRLSQTDLWTTKQ